MEPLSRPRLAREVFGVRFPNPIGLAAGFDKDAIVLPAWEKLGFGFVEAGTITASAQPGNPRPRIFRLPDQHALINRMGFNNDGAEAVAARLARLRATGAWPGIPIGLNIGKTKVTPLEEAAADLPLFLPEALSVCRLLSPQRFVAEYARAPLLAGGRGARSAARRDPAAQSRTQRRADASPGSPEDRTRS